MAKILGWIGNLLAAASPLLLEVEDFIEEEDTEMTRAEDTDVDGLHTEEVETALAVSSTLSSPFLVLTGL